MSKGLIQLSENFSMKAIDYSCQGNAILGLIDSGKSYTATKIAEQLMDAHIPFVAFDPIGIWKNLKIGANGHPGYPVVVIGDEGDLPLTPDSAPDILLAAMKEKVSIVFDLYSIELSKADWRKIVTNCVEVLLYKNKPFGLRHIFIEEAAEFCPQKIRPEDARVYDMIERLARMGGNKSLGYTLINQRAEQVNKAVLELCSCLILHNQKGKRSIMSLKDWFDKGGIDNPAPVIKSLPMLKQGEAWIWPPKSQEPTKIKVLPKNTIHPDRKGDTQIPSGSIKANVSEFVTRLLSSIPNAPAIPITEESSQKQNNKNHFVKIKGNRAIKIEGNIQENKNHTPYNSSQMEELKQQIETLKGQLSEEKKLRAAAEKKLDAVKKMLAPQFDQLKKIFDLAGETSGGSADDSVWEIWLNKFNGKNKDMLKVLIERGKVTRSQMALLVGMKQSGTFTTYISNLHSAGLLKKEGDYYVLQNPNEA